MKYLFFLKAIRGVRMPYSFRLYTYGPFDGDVLDDLEYAQSLRAVVGSVVPHARGHGYHYSIGPSAEEIEQQAEAFLEDNEESIDWVLRQFGNRSAMDLEMASTIVFVDMVLAARGARTNIGELTRKVRDVKPHLDVATIETEARELKRGGYLSAAE
jgi:hypothetical protein